MPRFVILDLDSTLVYSRPFDMTQPFRENARNFYVKPLSEELILQTTVRKHVPEFLDKLRDRGYRIIVWSAASPAYVKDIVSVIFAGREKYLEYLFTMENLRGDLKDLNVIHEFIPDFDVASARLIDDNPDHSRGQEKSFILVPPFVINKAKSTEQDDDVLDTLIDKIDTSFTTAQNT